MPIYPVVNRHTGEKQVLNLSIANYEQWRKDNPGGTRTGPLV